MSERGGGPSLVVISPVFNDWVCAAELLSRLTALSDELAVISVLFVNDGSTEAVSLGLGRGSGSPRTGIDVEVLHTGTNLGHQRAIALGLVHVAEKGNSSTVVVIDSDGEDDPADIPRLLARLDHENSEARAIVAQRAARAESRRFRVFYRVYKWLFHWSTGKSLDFGNFSALTPAAVQQLVRMPELWNHFPAAVMRSRMPITRVPTDRRPRFHGTSRMNFVALINHGLAGIATFSDVVFARLLIAVSTLMTAFVAAGVAVLVIRFSSDLAVPGWATAAMGFVLLALFQLLILLAIMTFSQLSARSSIPSTPLQAAPHYIRGLERISS